MPEDSPADRAEQKTIIEATQRALDYAHVRGVTLVAALGNSNEDVGLPAFDGQSPNFPPGNEHDRTVNNSCLDLPTENNNVISVSALGPSKTKADYSNWSYEETTLEASATDTPCMSNMPDGTFSYAHKNRPPSYTSYCEGTPVFNGWYGHGIVDALRAVEIGREIHVE